MKDKKTINIPEALHAAIKTMAQREGRTVSGLVLRLIEAGMKSMRK